MSAAEKVLWRPSASRIESAQITRFQSWLAERKQLKFDDYEALRQWSIHCNEQFWSSIWEYFDVSKNVPARMLCSASMPGARWCDGAHINFAGQMLRHWDSDRTAIFAASEDGSLEEISGRRLIQSVASFAAYLRHFGVGPGDCVAAILPNIPEAAIAMLACASVGATWVICAPEFGESAIRDRFSQVSPKLVLAAGGYRFGGKWLDRTAVINSVLNGLKSVEGLVQVGSNSALLSAGGSAFCKPWNDALKQFDEAIFDPLEFDFDHPLWVLFTSGTTGLPKGIVHGHGGIALEFHKTLAFHTDLSAESVVFLLSSTSWVVWNILVGCLIRGSAIVMYDGSPAYPDLSGVWKLIERTKTSYFGASPGYVSVLQANRVSPKAVADMSSLTGLLLSGAPVSAEQVKWCFSDIADDLWISSQSGGTEIASAFVGGLPTLPVVAGEIQTRCLGVDAIACNEQGEEVEGDIGELLIRNPMPSMPIHLLGDDNYTRYREAYFDEFPGQWRHGDFFKVLPGGSCQILGRSDAVLNRNGVRIGTSEFYRALESIPEVEDALIVDIDLANNRSHMPLFVKLAPAAIFDETLISKIKSILKTDCSPRHVPDEVIEVEHIPYNITGKKLEVPVRRLLNGAALEKTVNVGVLREPESLKPYLDYAERFAALSQG